MKIIVFLGLLLSAPLSFAYAPPYSMIISRVAENHGKGAYTIEDEVTFRNGTNLEIVHETWTILDENRLKVVFEGEGNLRGQFQGTYIYENRSRISKEGNSNHSRRLSESWLEPFFLFRYSKPMRNRIVQMKIAPPESLREATPLKADAPPNYVPESYVRLNRQDGMVSWAIRKSFDSPSDPGLWVEQDQFVVTKILTEDASQVDADDYAKHDGGLYFPRVRTYHWADKSVSVQVNSVHWLGTKYKEGLHSAPMTPSQFSGSDNLKDFFLRFR